MKRNPRLGMTRKIWISSALPLAAAMLVLAPTTAFAGSPLLSGYGGPGAGEQAVIGSTLIGGSRGGGAGGSSDSSNSRGSGATSLSGSVRTSTSGSGGTSSAGPGSVSSSTVGTANAGSGSGTRGSASKGGATSRALRGGQATSVGSRSANAYVYPTSQGSIPSASSLSGISSGGVLLLIGILATLALVAVLTLRLSQLQS
jgi:hypothetical protein